MLKIKSLPQKKKISKTESARFFLGDEDTKLLSAVAAEYYKVFPDKLNLIHTSFFSTVNMEKNQGVERQHIILQPLTLRSMISLFRRSKLLR